MAMRNDTTISISRFTFQYGSTSIANYCIDHDLNQKDLYTIDQSRWNSVLLYVYKQVFKPNKETDNKVYRYNEKSNIDYSNKELVN